MKKPFWVKVGLFGVKSRGASIAWLYLLIALFILSPVIIFAVLTLTKNAPLFPALVRSLTGGALVFLTCVWSWLCIKWMDDNKGWTQIKSGSK